MTSPDVSPQVICDILSSQVPIKIPRCYMNKKAQLGKIISSFPAIILTFFIMLIFIFLAASFSVLKNPTFSRSSIFPLGTEDILLQSVSINNENYLFLEALYLNHQGILSRSQLFESINPLLNEKNNCYILLDDITPPGHNAIIGYKLSNELEEIRDNPRNAIPNWENALKKTFSININKEIKEITYFFGRCP